MPAVFQGLEYVMGGLPGPGACVQGAGPTADDPSPAPKLFRWFALVFWLSATVPLHVDLGVSVSCPWCTHKLHAA